MFIHVLNDILTSGCVASQQGRELKNRPTVLSSDQRVHKVLSRTSVIWGRSWNSKLFLFWPRSWASFLFLSLHSGGEILTIQKVKEGRAAALLRLHFWIFLCVCSVLRDRPAKHVQRLTSAGESADSSDVGRKEPSTDEGCGPARF